MVQELFDVSLDVTREEPPAVPLERHAIGPDEELLEVPGHVVPADRAPDDCLGVIHEGDRLVAGGRESLLQEHKQRMGVLPVHVHLLQELKVWLKAMTRTDVLQRKQDFVILAVLLRGSYKEDMREQWTFMNEI